ncbi:MAG: gliding motility-associated C-terminal domain-containing protein [Winogradskyella sp.]|nr:gliding motility-associated C-terminal domain-containing protein [Winogradskyella sp.]
MLLCITSTLSAQDVSLFQQFNGRYDYTAIGNTLNTIENGPANICVIETSSSAFLNLNPTQNVIAAYLYWAGSGSGDLNVTLNGIPVMAERSFDDALDSNRVFFAAFADVTDIVAASESSTYTLADLDLTDVIGPFCSSGTNFGGWAITIIYQDDNLPLNQLNVYDGLQSVPSILNITLNNLNVLDNEDAKIGFIAWEGDSALAINEQLTINGNVISNLPLNPPNNAFNGTNSFTGATDLYNMDIDVYNIQDNINIGDTAATITLTSGQDFVMVNNIITVLNSQLPDATIIIDNYNTDCGDNRVEIVYTVNNFNSTAVLPSNTPIAFYINNILVGQSQTQNAIPIGSSESGSVIVTIPDEINSSFSIDAIVDDNGTMEGTVTETNEENNSDFAEIMLLVIPEITVLPGLKDCNKGFGNATFNLFDSLESVTYNEDDIAFYLSLNNLENETNSILNPSNYSSSATIIYARLERPPCYEILEFQLNVENCPPNIPEGFSPNNDSINDWFNIGGLYNIFTEHKLQIYNRYGEIVFEGNNDKPWLGLINKGINASGNLVPVGTYYYILNLNDSNYKPIIGWVYVNY